MTASGRSTSRSAAACKRSCMVCCCNAVMQQGGLLHAHSVVLMYCLAGQHCQQRLASCDCLSAAVTEAEKVWAARETCTAEAALQPNCTAEHQPASSLAGQVHDWHAEQQQVGRLPAAAAAMSGLLADPGAITWPELWLLHFGVHIKAEDTINRFLHHCCSVAAHRAMMGSWRCYPQCERPEGPC